MRRRLLWGVALALLTHGGQPLGAQGGGHQKFGDPVLLRRALDHGVRVIVAHCASLGDATDSRHRGKEETTARNFQVFLDMMRDPNYEDMLYGDLSEITQVNRAPEAIETLLVTADIHHRLLNGFDYPLTGILPLFSSSQLQRLGLIDAGTASVVFEIQKYNPLRFDLMLKRNLRWMGRRLPRQFFETAGFFQNASGNSACYVLEVVPFRASRQHGSSWTPPDGKGVFRSTVRVCRT